jgi:hypothetical protein
MRRLVAALTLSVALVPWVSVAPAVAEEPPEAAARVRGAFPEPSAKHGFHATYDVVMGDRELGSWEMGAEPVTEDGKTRWRLHERMTDAQGAERTAESFAEADLRGVRGTFAEGSGDGAQQGTWTYADGKVVVRRGAAGEAGASGDEDAGDVEEIDAATPPLPGFPALLLFCRLVPEEAAKYDVPVHDTIGGQIETIALDVRGPAMWTAKGERFRVWLVVATMRGNKVRLGFSFPGRGEFLGLDGGESGTSLVRRTSPDAATMPDLSAPAATPEAAAIKQVVGLATGDADLLRAAFHWPTLHAAARERDPSTNADLETYRASAIEAMRAAAKAPQSRADAEAAVQRGLANKSVTPAPDRPDRAEVTLHVGSTTHVMHVARIDDVWYVVPKE